MDLATERQRLLRLARDRTVLTTQEVDREGIHRQVLTRLVRDGKLERIERGQYRMPEAELSEHHGLVVASVAVPHGVICLLSALAFHGVGTQLPSRVWIAIERRRRLPKVDSPPVEVVTLSGSSFHQGIEVHRLEGREVRIYGLAKTLADVFKFRNKIGLEVALEALRDAWRERRIDLDEVDRYARICRVQEVMRPYVEALVA